MPNKFQSDVLSLYVFGNQKNLHREGGIRRNLNILRLKQKQGKGGGDA